MTFAWAGTCTVYVTVTATDFNAYAQTLTLTTGGATVIAMTPTPGSWCCQQFDVLGCNGLGINGATVTVKTSSTGTTLATGTTNPSGVVQLQWAGSCSVYVAITASRFTSYGSSLTLTESATTSTTLSITSGYVCLAGFAIPAPDTLHGTSSLLGAVTFTYNASGTHGAAGTPPFPTPTPAATAALPAR